MDKPLDLDKMREAASIFVGEHDFKSFCSNKHMKKSTVRIINSIDIVESDDKKIELINYINSKGFDIKNEDDLIACVKTGNYRSFKATGEYYNYKYATLHSVGIITGGFAYGLLNHCMAINHKKKSNLILDAIEGK